jgi:hypothetical protein
MTVSLLMTGRRPEAPLWENLIRSACSAVAAEPVWLIEAVLIDQHFHHLTEAERDQLLEMAYRVAAEYGVVAMPEPYDESLAIWFGRRERREDAQRAIRLAYPRPPVPSVVPEGEDANG